MSVNRVDHAEILVTDVGAALEWYEGALGLTVLECTRKQAHVTCAGDHADITLVRGGHGVSSFAIGVDGPEDLERIEQKLERHNVDYERISEPGRPGAAQLTRFELIGGYVMELVIANDGRTAGETNFEWDGASATPTDIDHINLLGTEAPARVAEFLTEIVGFKLSGAMQIENELVAVWTRAATLDHDVAYMRAVRPGDRLHHFAFAMIDGNHYMLLADRLVAHGFRFEFGPGRHTGAGSSGFGSNLFAYAFDPSGNRVEFSGDMAHLPEDADVGIHNGSEGLDEIMNAWAPNMPESFMAIGS
jgi:catechol 2,3-dioxygenase